MRMTLFASLAIPDIMLFIMYRKQHLKLREEMHQTEAAEIKQVLIVAEISWGQSYLERRKTEFCCLVACTTPYDLIFGLS